MKELKAAILGAGGMGRCHGNSLKKIDGVTLTAICDSDLSRAKSLIDELGVPAKAYESFDEMLEKESFDLLYICLPPFVHDGQFEKAAAKGIHIFIEKPIAITSMRGESMVAAAKAAKIYTHVGFHMRFGSAVTKLRAMMENGEAGRPVLFNGRYQCNSLHTPWWRDIYRSGGQIFEQAIHVYDMCRYIFGNPQNTMGVMGNICHADNPSYTVEDVSSSISKFSSGALASITATNCAIPGKWDALFDITFEKVTASFSDPDTATFYYVQPDGTCKEESFCKETDQKFEETRAFIKLIREGGTSACSIEEGLRSLYFVEAVVQSATMDGAKMPIRF